MIAIPNMDKPKNCAECFHILKCKAVPRWVTADDSIPKSCPLIEIDEKAFNEVIKGYLEGLKAIQNGERRSDERINE